jgi:hypothetical protein
MKHDIYNLKFIYVMFKILDGNFEEVRIKLWEKR